MNCRSALFAFLLAAAPAAAAEAPVNMAGTWDLTWQTRKGPRHEGYLVVRQEGSKLATEIHGRGAVKATGSIDGTSFTLRGSRMAVPYRIEGTVAGNRLNGAIKVLSVERRFTGLRRR